MDGYRIIACIFVMLALRCTLRTFCFPGKGARQGCSSNTHEQALRLLVMSDKIVGWYLNYNHRAPR